MNRWDAMIDLLCVRAALAAAVCNELEASDPDGWPGNQLAWNALYHYEAWLEAHHLETWTGLSPEEAAKDTIRGMAIPRDVLVDGTLYKFRESDAIIKRIACADGVVDALGFMRSADHGSELREDVATLAPLVKGWIELMSHERLRWRAKIG
jgi:hypothetical protein